MKTKKLIKYKNGFALVLDKLILDHLGFDHSTELEVIVIGDTLIVKPQKCNPEVIKKRQDAVSKTANEIMDRYEEVFKKLAKS